jgi:hypothetical protein
MAAVQGVQPAQKTVIVADVSESPSPCFNVKGLSGTDLPDAAEEKNVASERSLRPKLPAPQCAASAEQCRSERQCQSAPAPWIYSHCAWGCR